MVDGHFFFLYILHVSCTTFQRHGPGICKCIFLKINEQQNKNTIFHSLRKCLFPGFWDLGNNGFKNLKKYLMATPEIIVRGYHNTLFTTQIYNNYIYS